MKYTIPRNKIIPDPSFKDVIISGPSYKNEQGQAIGDSFSLFRGTDQPLAKADLTLAANPGQMIIFKEGLIYLPDEALTYFGTIKDVLIAGLAFTGGELVGGLAEHLIGQLPWIVNKILSDQVEDVIFPEKKEKALYVDELVKRGALYLPFVQVVEVEHAVVPSGGLFRKAESRLQVTYEPLDGKRTAFILKVATQQGAESMGGFMLESRARTEIDHLIAVVKNEQFDATPLFISHIEKYRARYGQDLSKHLDALITEVNLEATAERERRGFTLHHLNAELLKRLAPLLDLYRELPYFKNWVSVMEELKANPDFKLERVENITNPIGIELVWIPPGEFMMGANNLGAAMQPVHKVTIKDGFFMGKYEVTQAQWLKLMKKSWSTFKGDNFPVHRMSSEDAITFIAKLNAQNDGYTYRLPSEAEWDYAARAGTTGDYAGYLDAMAWYSASRSQGFRNSMHPVGLRKPNAFGLYDMHGNVFEWCQDWYHPNYEGAPTDGSAWVTGGEQKYRVPRGGSWNLDGAFCKSAFRMKVTFFNRRTLFIGLRVVAVART